MNSFARHLRAFVLATAVVSAARLAAAPAAGESAAAAPLALPPTPVQRGQELARELRTQQFALNSAGVLRRRDAEGRWLAPIPVQLEVAEGTTNWQSVYRAFDAQERPLETLVVTHQPDAPNRYAVGVAGSDEPRELAGNQAQQPFAGTDFWLCDLGLEFLHWPGQKVLRSEIRKSRSCWVLESTQSAPPANGYARVLSWIDVEKKGLLRAEAYDAAGQLLKEFSIGSLKKVGGRWQLKSMEIRNERTDARTRLEFELEVED